MDDTDGAAEDKGSAGGRQRVWLARAGVTALNLIAPGLGLVRIGRLRQGLLFFTAPLLLALGLIALAAACPVPSFAVFAVIAVLLLAFTAAWYVAPLAMTWRASRLRGAVRWWSRWYALAALVLGASMASQATLGLMHRFYKPFYLPGESMVPTIYKGEKILADMRGGRAPRRGDVIMFAANGSTRVDRVAAVAGDTIAMRRGVPVIDAREVPHRIVGKTTFAGFQGAQRATLIEERLPGEAGTHRVLDVGYYEAMDDMPPVQVTAGTVFVLGDNRDRSADSRVPKAYGGVGLVPLGAIVGRPLYVHWSGDRARIGTRIDP